MKPRLINALSTAAVAIFFAHVLHEAVHLIVALLVGAPVKRFNLFAVDITLYGEGAFIWHDIGIEAGASLANVVVGFAALALFYFSAHSRPLLRQLWLQLAGYNLLMGFGYFLFDALFYSPEVPGDWRSVITMLDGSIVLRTALIVTGATGMLFTMFWLARAVLVFVRDKHAASARFEAAFPVLLVPYLVFGTLYAILSLWHPLGFPEGLIITVLQFFFGFSGLLWAFMLAVHWLKPGSRALYRVDLPQKISPGWLAAAVVLLLLQVLVLLPTIHFT